MKKVLLLVFLLVAAGAGALAWLRRQESAALRVEIAVLRDEQREREKLQKEIARLKASAVSPQEFARLQSDHAAARRLRAELETLRADVERREKALAAPVARDALFSPPPGGEVPRNSTPPALVLPLEIAAGGAMTLDGAAVNLDEIRRRMSGLPAGSTIEIRLRELAPVSTDKKEIVEQRLAFQRSREQLVRLARELGLKIAFRSERPRT